MPDALRGDRLRLNPDEIWLDVWALETAPSIPTTSVASCWTASTCATARRSTPGSCWPRPLARPSMEELRERALDRLDLRRRRKARRRSPAGPPSSIHSTRPRRNSLLGTLVAAGHEAQERVHLPRARRLRREGLPVSPALRHAARGTGVRPRTRTPRECRRRFAARAGTAALTAGAVDAGVETLRRAAEEVAGAGDKGLEAESCWRSAARLSTPCAASTARARSSCTARSRRRGPRNARNRRRDPSRRAGLRGRTGGRHASAAAGADRGPPARRRPRRRRADRPHPRPARDERGRPWSPQHRYRRARRVGGAGRPGGRHPPAGMVARPRGALSCCSAAGPSRPAGPPRRAWCSRGSSAGPHFCRGRRSSAPRPWPSAASGTPRTPTPSRPSRSPASWRPVLGRHRPVERSAYSAAQSGDDAGARGLARRRATAV